MNERIVAPSLLSYPIVTTPASAPVRFLEFFAANIRNSHTRRAYHAAMVNHASTRTAQLYDRRHDQISSDKVKRIVI